MEQLYVADYVSLLALLVISASVGLFHGCKSGLTGSEPMREYALAGGKMAVLPVALSISATVLSGSALVGVAGEVYYYSGTEYLSFGIGGALGLILSGILVVPVYRKIQYVSVYEYLERRFDRYMRLLFSVVYILSKTMFISVALYVPALSLSTLTSFPQWLSVLISGAICISYCVIGGMKAVIWTDVLQAFFMVTCNLLLIGFGLYNVGGIGRAWDIALQGGRIGYVTWLENENSRYSVWSLTVGSTIIFMNSMCAGQAGVQRILTVKGLEEARRTTFLGAFMVLFFMVLSVLVGLILYSNYAGCDPILRQDVPEIKSPDQVLVYAIADLLGGVPGLRGLALAGIFSGSLSTFSSYINSFATLTVEDLVPKRFLGTGDKRKLLLCKVFTFVYGSVSIFVAFYVPYMGGVIQTSALITGAAGGPLTAVILLGILSKRSSKRGVIFGLVVGLALTSWIAVGSRLQANRPKLYHLSQSIEGCEMSFNSTLGTVFDEISHNKTLSNKDYFKNFYSISFMWYGPIGLATTLILGYIASLVSGDYDENIDERLFYNLKQKKEIRKEEYFMVQASDDLSYEISQEKVLTIT